VVKPTKRKGYNVKETEIIECPTAGGCHYDYDRQAWVDGHDHYHVKRGLIEMFFCGQALAGCRRVGA